MWCLVERNRSSAEIKKKKLKGTFDEEFEVLRECVHPVTGIL